MAIDVATLTKKSSREFHRDPESVNTESMRDQVLEL